MGSHFNVLAASSPIVWERFLAAENRLTIEKWGRLPEPDEEVADDLVSCPWFQLLHRGCRSTLGDYCLEESVRAERLDALLLEGEWYAWAPCYSLNITTRVELIERRGGRIIESRARLGMHLIRRDPYLLLKIDDELGIPVGSSAP